MRFRFDVYGLYQLVVEKAGESWRVLQVGNDGKRGLRTDLAIPQALSTAEEIGEYLDVLLHEHARAGRSVRLLSSNGSE